MKLQEPGIVIYGRYDDPKITLCQSVLEKVSAESNLKFNFHLYAETQFESFRDKLIIEDQRILDLVDTPIVYEIDKNLNKQLIGNYERFLKWISTNYHYFEDRKLETFKDKTNQNIEKMLNRKEFRYVFFNINIGNTSKGKVVLELFYDRCPKTCDNFISLCKGFKSKSGDLVSYGKSGFHRIVKNSYIQGGDIVGNFPKSIYEGDFADEAFSVDHDAPGIIGMAKKGGRKHSNECQFYITTGEMRYFDKKYVAFGRVVKGFNIIREIENIECYLQRPLTRVSISEAGEYKV